jgi:hypothetical protein
MADDNDGPRARFAQELEQRLLRTVKPNTPPDATETFLRGLIESAKTGEMDDEACEALLNIFAEDNGRPHRSTRNRSRYAARPSRGPRSLAARSALATSRS